MGLVLKSKLFTIILSIAITLFTFPTLVGIASLIETTWYPVAYNFKVETITNGRKPDTIILYGTIGKNRNCQFENTSFFKKTRYGDVIVDARRLTKRLIQSAPKGDTNLFGPWAIDMTKEEFETMATIRTLHKCHPLYLTESVPYNKGELK